MPKKRVSKHSKLERTKSDPTAKKRASRAKPKVKQENPAVAKHHASSNKMSFPIVAIGASAGGFDAFSSLLRSLPAKTGMAYVFVQHLERQHESKLDVLLSRITRMPVVQVTQGMQVQPDHLYIIPPNKDMIIAGGTLQLGDRPPGRGVFMPIDRFFCAVADVYKNQAIGVILSGNATDGTIGMRAIKDAGGITIAQATETAEFPGMPHNAIISGAVDFVMTPQEIAAQLTKIGRHPYVKKWTDEEDDAPTTRDKLKNDIQGILQILRSATHVDFSYYKQTTVRRRIHRRMVLGQFKNYAEYIKHLENDPHEADSLYHDLLINVTSFFRDPETFEVLKNNVFPALMQYRSGNVPIRIWVPGCATGEEAYSIAISLVEYLDNEAPNTPIQIFASDISDVALAKARAAIYPSTIEADVSHARLRRFFVKGDHGYQISRQLRSLIVFARQNVVTDPPFSQMDLISCRNLLIYLGSVLQKKVIPIFHYALRPHGFLMLGNAESITSFMEHFHPADKKHRIYRKKLVSQARFPDSTVPVLQESMRLAVPSKEEVWSGMDLQREADRLILSKYTPPSVVINESMEILQFRGKTGLFLEPAPGAASFNVLKMAHQELTAELKSAIQKVRRTNSPVHRAGIHMQDNGNVFTVNLEVLPLRTTDSPERFFLILFDASKAKPGESQQAETAAKTKGAPASVRKEVQRLNQELSTTREYLQSIIEDQEATNEELKSANEEILSGNEELQSTNEELETAKEELQSTNEELTTVNEELQNRNAELSQLNDDLENLLAGVNIPIVIVSEDLKIRRFTAMAEQILNMIPGDVGRKISDIRMTANLYDFEQRVREVIETMTLFESEIQDQDGKWYRMRIRPYRTTDNRIAGAVIIFVDIDAMKRNMEQLQQSTDFIQAVIESVREGLLVLNPEMKIKSANRAFYQTFQVSPDEVEERNLFDLGSEWNIQEIRQLLSTPRPDDNGLNSVEITQKFRRVGSKTILVTAVPVRQQGSEQLILLSIADITLKKQAETAMASRTLLEEIHHRVKNNLQIISSLLFLQSNYTKDPEAKAMFQESQNRVRAMAYIHENLYQSENMAKLDFGKYVKRLTTDLLGSYDISERQIKIDVNIHDISFNMDTAIPCALIINELVTNAIKYAFPGDRTGKISIALKPENGRYSLAVVDNGIGIEKPDQLDASSLGLKLVSTLTTQLGGTLDIQSSKGASFTIVFDEQKRGK